MSAPLLRLHVTPAEGAPFDHVVRSDSLTVGRAMDADLTISDPFLSRRHSRFYQVDSSLFVEDLGSRNGTEVNGKVIQSPVQLRPGDVVKVSNSLITVCEDAPILTARDVREDDLLEDGTIFRPASELLGRQSAPTAAGEAGLRRYADRLRLLNQVHQALGRPLTLGQLLDLILDRVFDHLKPDRVAILLKDSGEYRVAAIRSVEGDLVGPAFSRSLVREVGEKGMAAVVFDVNADERFAAAQSMLISGIRSLIAAPLLDLEEALGLIVLESRTGARQFSEEDLELLVSLASVAALHLRNLALATEAAERRRLEEELALARRIQVALLPNHLPTLPGWELYGGNIPSRGVSGDYYEVVERDGGREHVLMVADVAGKGMAASLLTVSLQALSTGPIMDGLPPDEICASLSRLLYLRTPPEKYATAFFGVLEPATGRLRYTNAGHNPPLIVRTDGTVEELAATGVPLGLLAQAPYRSAQTELGPGDLLVLYTDGLVEACGPGGEEYGQDRLKEACLRHREEEGLAALAEALENDLEAFAGGVPFADDRTIVLARRSIR